MPPLPKPTDPQRTVLLSIPLFHVTGNLSWLMRAIHGGSKMVYMRHWNVKEAVKLIMEENVTVIGGYVRFLYHEMVLIRKCTCRCCVFAT
jgi:acyl-CoA synthetase (AMP-forming)/AMP-acid ligase II